MAPLLERTRSDPAQLALGPLADALGFLLRISQIATFEKLYADLGASGVRAGEFSVLWLISQNPRVRQGVLARSLYIKNARMTKMIRGFETQGLIQRHIPDADRRAVELTLTDSGRAFVDTHRTAFFSDPGESQTNLTSAEMAQLIGLLQKFIGLEERS
ncbi:MAG: MarR family winged helix-turn-helix transcriptional regulator [Qingshengfaniella sp.]